MKKHDSEQVGEDLSFHWNRLFENSFNEIYIFDAENLKFMQVSKGALSNLGYSMQEMSSLTPLNLKPEMDSQTFQALLEPLLEGQQELVVFKTLHQRKDGSCYPIEVRLQYAPEGTVPVFIAIIHDLTEHKQTVNTLTETRRMLQLVLDTIPVRVFWKDLESVYLGCNRHFAADAGLNYPEQIIGMNDFELPWNEQADLYRADDNKVMESGQSRINYEEPQTRPDGTSLILRTSKIPLRNAAGKVLGVLGCYEDITEQKHAEQALEKAHQEWIQAMDYFEDSIILVSLDERIIRANKTFYRFTGLTQEQTIGQDPARILHPQGEKEDCPVCSARKAHKDSRVILEADHPANPSGRPVEITIRVIRNNDGKPQSILIATHDLTHQRDIENELRRHRDHLEEQVAERTAKVHQQARIIDQINDSVVGADMSGSITFWNQGAERLFEYRADEVIGKPLTILYPDEKIRANPDIIERIRTSGVYVMETRLQRKSGVIFDAHVSASADYDDSRQLKGIYTYTLDITERKRMIDTLERERAALKSANQELKSFSYSVSHDLRAPLRALDGFSLALQEDYAETLPEEGRHYLQRIRGAAQHMGHLIDNLLMISRVSQRKLQHRPVNLSLLVKKITAQMIEQDISRNITLKIQHDVIVLGDEPLLQIALENLIGNAWKYTSKTSDACIEFGMQTQEGNQVCFVRDNGVGFNMHYADKLFVAFQRLHSPEEFEGTGIGLATVGRIIYRHGGQVWAEAEVGRGACFYFTLP